MASNPPPTPKPAAAPAIVQPKAPPPAKAAPPMMMSAGPPKVSIPYLLGAGRHAFGRMDSDYQVRSVTVSIDNQLTVPQAVYNQMLQLAIVDFNIDLYDFVRMWKTLILKRVQNVYARETMQRAEHSIPLSTPVVVPAPLGDLLTSLGQFKSQALGSVINIEPPNKPPEVQAWWTVDAEILTHWIQTMSRMHSMYQMCDTPPGTDYQNKPIVLTAIRDNGEFRTVKSFANEAQPVDGLIRFVNDDLFVPPFKLYDDCDLMMTEPLYREQVVGEYVASYVI